MDNGPTLFGSVDDLAGGDEARGAGRPALAAGDRHDAASLIRFTPGEFAEVFRAARSENSCPAVWIREAAVMRARGAF